MTYGSVHFDTFSPRVETEGLTLPGVFLQPGLSVLVFLLSACDSLAATLSSEPLKLPIYLCHLRL